MQSLASRDVRGEAVVSAGGAQVTRLPLSEDAEYIWESPDGDRNVISVQGGTVSVTSANCPDRICVMTGKITKQGEVIACLPHELMVYVEE